MHTNKGSATEQADIKVATVPTSMIGAPANASKGSAAKNTNTDSATANADKVGVTAYANKVTKENSIVMPSRLYGKWPLLSNEVIL